MPGTIKLYATLKITKGNYKDEGDTIFLTDQLFKAKQIITIGRAVSDFNFKDEGISSKHIGVSYNENEKAIYIKDLDSSNGTIVNNKVISHIPTKLNDGDTVILGKDFDYAVLEYSNRQKDLDKCIALDTKTRDVKVNNKKLDPRLSPLLFDILLYLNEREGQVCTFEDIYKAAWKEEFYKSGTQISKAVSRLRERIEPNQGEPIYIKGVHGLGFTLFNPQLKTS